MRASSRSFNFKPQNIPLKRFFAILTSALVVIATVASSVPSTVSADAVKRIDGTGPFQAGETVTVEFRIPRITSVQVDPVEIVFVVDASGSLAGAISTAKSQMNSFADWLAGYYGYAKVGVVSFGMDEDNSPGLRTHMSLRTIDDSTDVTAMHNAINSISARADGYGFSDIQKGLIRGNSLFTDPSTTAASGRHLVLLTDGLANYPASGSIGFGYPWNGVCPLHPSPERSSISGLRYSHFIIIPQGPTGNGIPAYAQWYGSTGLDYYIPPCASYIQTHHGGWLTGMGLIDNMIAHYPGIRRKESSMQTTIDFLQNVITPTTIRAHDTINSAVFSSIPDSGVVRNCSTGTIISGSNNTVGGTGLTIDTNMPYSSSVALYCVRFRATLNTSISSGTYEINRTAFNNWIRYYNVYGTVIGNDGIQGGSMTISGNPDMAATEFWLTNSSGTQKRVFNRNESIYAHTQITNVGDSTMPAGFKTAYYKHASSSLAANTSSDIPMYITGHGALGAGGVREYDSYSSTFPSTTDPNGANTSGARPWTQSTAGNYNALVFTNYQAMSEASFPTNNRRGLGYSVITPPSNLQTSNLLCHQTNLTWTAGSSNISGYDIEITDMVALLASLTGGPAYVDYISHPASVGSSQTSITATNLKPNTLYAWVLTPKTAYGSGSPVSINFTTPACPTYTIDVGGPYAAEPGETENIPVNISYTPNATTWNNYDARIDIRVVGINYNNESCAAYAPNGAPRLTALDDFSVRVSGNPSVASQVIGPSSYPFQVNFTASTTANTNTGRYTICIGYFSPDSYITYRDVSAVHVNVELHPWIQIDRPAGFTSSMVGDVHSNATIDLSVPLNQYFFKNGTAGVVSAYGTSGNHISFASDRTTNVANKLWRIPSYSQQVKTEAYSNLVSLAEAALDNPAAGIPSGSSSVPSTANITAHCATGGGVFSYTPGSGTLTRTTEINLSSQACAGKNLVYFINGNLAHNANIIDDTNDATITFIVSGNVTVAPTVTQLDGVHIFGGSFRDGSVYDPETGGVDDPLVINGSLIGLATQSPVSTKGTFSQGTYSGLQRNLSFGASGNDNLPAERIAYQPKYLYLLREILGSSSFTWSE